MTLPANLAAALAAVAGLANAVGLAPAAVSGVPHELDTTRTISVAEIRNPLSSLGCA